MAEEESQGEAQEHGVYVAQRDAEVTCTHVPRRAGRQAKERSVGVVNARTVCHSGIRQLDKLDTRTAMSKHEMPALQVAYLVVYVSPAGYWSRWKMGTDGWVRDIPVFTNTSDGPVRHRKRGPVRVYRSHLWHYGKKVPYKWKFTCDLCTMVGVSWSWQREDGSGALQMANEHMYYRHMQDVIN